MTVMTVSLTFAQHDEDVPLEKRLLWLKKNKEPWKQVINYWKSTEQMRNTLLKSGNISAIDYFNAYPALKEPKGFHLLMEDFNDKYFELKDNFMNVWHELKDKILKLVEHKCIVERTFKNLLVTAKMDYSNTSDDAEKSLLAFTALGFLLPCAIGPRDKSSNKVPRYSKIQASDAFLVKADSEEDMFEKLKVRRQALERVGSGDQPIPVVIGDGKTKGSCKVNVGDTYYSLDSPEAVIDTCFKLFFALGTNYPPEAKHIWTFVQKFLYRIHFNYDCNYPSLYQLAIELGIHKI